MEHPFLEINILKFGDKMKDEMNLVPVLESSAFILYSMGKIIITIINHGLREKNKLKRKISFDYSNKRKRIKPCHS